MKRVTIFLSMIGSLNIQSQELNVMTFNIRYNTKNDSLNAWPYRKDKVASLILFHNIHILGVQEALHDQVMDLEKSLAHYKYTGVGRDDGKAKGEYSAIFYDSTRCKLLKFRAVKAGMLPLQGLLPGQNSGI
jgi:endonuclease/exonuclease/phosphatase family metal-dependent hydrolase